MASQRPVRGSPHEWNLHEDVAHVYALNGDGLQSVRCVLERARYTFESLADHYKFSMHKTREGSTNTWHCPSVVCA